MANNETKTAIKTSFLRLLGQKPLRKISVKQIAEDSKLSRNTFYYHFQDVPELLEEIILEGADDLIRKYPTVDDMGVCIEEAYQFAKKNKKAIMHIYRSVDRDVFEKFLMKMSDHAAHTHVEAMLKGKNASPEDREALINFLKCQCFGLCMDWTLNGMNDDIVEAYNRIIVMFVRLLNSMLPEENDRE